jgi:thiol-disulfide isomerase/thioredoxin
MKIFLHLVTICLLGIPIPAFAASDPVATDTLRKSVPNRIFAETTRLAGSDPQIRENNLVLIQLWASWCTRCATMFGDLEQFATDHQELPVIALSIDEDENAARAYLTRHAAAVGKASAISYRHDRAGQIAREYQINAVPTVLLVGSDGSVLTRTAGHLKKSDLLKIARHLTP